MKTTILLAAVLLLSLGMASVAVAQDSAVSHNTWSSGTPMPATPVWGSGAGTINNKIYVVGGETASLVEIGANRVYNTKTNTWTAAAPMPTPVWATATAVVNGILYVIGGYVTKNNISAALVQTYNPTSFPHQPLPTGSFTASVDRTAILGKGHFTTTCRSISRRDNEYPVLSTKYKLSHKSFWAGRDFSRADKAQQRRGLQPLKEESDLTASVDF